MPKKESPLAELTSFLPVGCFDQVVHYIQKYKVHLTVTRDRKSILGNYRNKVYDKTHRISVNGSLNKYSFLITLLHELAHLLAFEKYGHRIQPHGKEWKTEYSNILNEFIPHKFFPADIEKILLKTLKSPAASSCADTHLMRVLRNYDHKKEGFAFVEELAEGSLFSIKGGRVFKKGLKVRTRYKCIEISNKKAWLFSGVYEVKKVLRT